MAEDTCIQFEVALVCGGDTISGTIDDHSDQPLTFTGWLELMSAFDTVCTRNEDRKIVGEVRISPGPDGL